MIWPLLICFSVSVLALSASDVSGQVLLHSKLTHGHPEQDGSGVAVWLEPVSDEPVRLLSKPTKVRITQKNKIFLPHVLIVPVGTVVDFPNDDPIFHNAFSNYNGQIFDIGLYPPGTSRSITFRRPGIVRVFCNIHANMSAVIVVVNTIHFAVTGKDGFYRMEGVPKGTYRLQFYDERATEKTLSALSRTVVIGNENHNLGGTDISEAGYLSVPHMNKYGKPYPPVTDATGYAGSQQ